MYCYFDDCIGDEHELHSEFTGELLLINEFNTEERTTKLSRINGLRHKRIFDAAWNDVVFIAHHFEHPDYNTFINPRSDWQMPLSS